MPALDFFVKLIASAVIIGFLYFGRPVLLPIAMALFLALILTPLVTALHRRRVPRTLAVFLVVFTVAAALSTIAVAVSMEITSLTKELPTHTENIKGKVRSVRGLSEGVLVDRFGQMWTELRAEWQVQPRRPTDLMPQPPSNSESMEGRLTVTEPTGVAAWAATRAPGLLRFVVDTALTAGFALVLTFFILLRREALRDRLVSLVSGSLIVTTKAVDDAGDRISRYLRMQVIINSTYGAVWGLGLYFIGLEYAALWAFLAAALRFVPYIGPWIAGVLPLALALAQFPGWWQPVAILALLIVLELVSNNLMEPMLYGRSTGVSEVAMLVSTAFWTFVWGPVGLVLSGPIAVCLAVVGKHFAHVSFLNLLFGDDIVLEPHTRYYQRLVARDQDEATRLALAQMEFLPLDRVFDELLIPALNQIKHDRVRTEVTEADELFVIETTREIVEELFVEEVAETVQAADRDAFETPSSPGAGVGARIHVMGFPARDREDQLALEMLRHMLSRDQWEFEIEPAGGASTGEWIDRVAKSAPALVCVASLPPGGLAHTRYVCKKLRARLPAIRIIVGRWGLKSGLEVDQERIESVGADQTSTTLRETCDQLNSWLPVFVESQTRRPTGVESAPESVPGISAIVLPSEVGNGT